MRRATIGLLAVALIALTVAAIAGAHIARYPTTVTIKLNKANKKHPAESFSGNVNSPKPRCQRGRTILVSRNNGFVGQTVSDASGSWQLSLGGQAATSGSYTAAALKKVYRRHRPGHRRHRHVCKFGLSKALTVKGAYGR